MRTHGTLAKWNEDRGFGFISPAQGHAELFVHISAFPRDGRRPEVGELVSFEIEAGAEGKSRAVRVMRPGSPAATHRAPWKHKQQPSKQRWGFKLAVVLVVAAIGGYAYVTKITVNDSYVAVSDGDAAPDLRAAPGLPARNFQCDGRTMCSQMSSCEEATYFLRHCPNTKMDGNGDGEPCEQQWCN